MIFVDWGTTPITVFAELEKLKELGIKFMAAPGTTSWCSLPEDAGLVGKHRQRVRLRKFTAARESCLPIGEISVTCIPSRLLSAAGLRRDDELARGGGDILKNPRLS